MQDLKTGHLLGASPKAQFYGQIIGATVGAVLSSFVGLGLFSIRIQWPSELTRPAFLKIYLLYTRVYTIPSDLVWSCPRTPCRAWSRLANQE